MRPADGSGSLVIGLGNALRGDDAAGLLVTRRVRAARPELDVLEHEGEPVSLLGMWERRPTVFLVDAIGGAAAVAGNVRRFDAAAAPLPAAAFGGPSTHALGLADTIELARTLGRLPERVTVLGIEGEAFELGERPSPAVLDAVARVTAAIVAEVPRAHAARGQRPRWRPSGLAPR